MATNISNGKLERIAVAAVKAEANKPSSLLIANISEGDKGISFDGEILVFKDHSESVDSLIRKVPVQVKGTLVDSFSQGKRTFPLGLDHYRNYYNSNGVVLFVVEILKTGETKIFYKQLLPKELREIIKCYGEVKNQKQRSVTLRPLSETSLDAVCRRFIHESKKQPPILIENNPFTEDEFTSFELTSLTFDPKRKETSNIFEHDFTLYGIKENLNVPLHLARIHSVSTKLKETVVIDNNEYEFNLKITEEPTKKIFLIEDSLELKYNVNDTKMNFTIRRLDSLATQLKIIPFLIDLVSGKEIYFKNLSFTFGKVTIKEKHLLEELKNLYSMFLKLQKVFQKLNVDEKTKFGDKDGEFDKIVNKINPLVHMILENDYRKLKIKEPDIPKFTNYQIGDIQLIFFYNPESQTKLINAFSIDLLQKDARVVIGDKSYPYSPYVLLNKSALAYGAKIDFEVIKESFNQFDPFVSELFPITNDFCLRCINAYDISNNIKLLELAEHIYNKYPVDAPGKNVTSEFIVVTINRLQIKLRKEGRLSDDEYQQLINLRNFSKDNLEAQFCTSVLLESKTEAKLIFQRFEKSRQKFYEGLPIYHLYKKLIE